MPVLPRGLWRSVFGFGGWLTVGEGGVTRARALEARDAVLQVVATDHRWTGGARDLVGGADPVRSPRPQDALRCFVRARRAVGQRGGVAATLVDQPVARH